jgi:hypothetical protein
MISPKTFYQQHLQSVEADLERVQRRYLLISNARLVIFLAGVGLAYWLFRIDFWWGMVLSVLALGGFMYLLKVHSGVAERRDHLRRLRRLLREELDAQAWDFSAFDPGEDHIDPHHAYSYDLDLFGKRALFQYLNRTGTSSGRTRLLSWLTQPEQDATIIMARQAAAQELSERTAWGLRFQALSRAHRATELAVQELMDWLQTPLTVSRQPVYRVLLYLLPGLLLLSLLGWILPDLPGLRQVFGGWHLPGLVPLALFLLQLAIAGRNLRLTNEQHQQIGRKARLLSTYSQLLQEMEEASFQSDDLQALQQQLSRAGHQASQEIATLGDLAYRFDQRLNMIAGILLNGTLMWDLRYLIRFERWRESHQEVVPQWFAVIGEVDALLSLGRYAFNRPDFTWPEMSEGTFFYHAEGLGHPLLAPETRVDNDVKIGQPSEFLIITGANMAGKSTFLRSVGVSLVLAMAGAPVCARRLRMAPVPLITSVRATDSLADHESYFYAELKQLKRIIDQLLAQGPAFVIVDEMLRGTNSRDKQVGSRRFIERLLSLGGAGLVATHDLSLGTLAEDYPGQVFNKRFEVDITDDKLTFDYRLRDGISQNLNATFLMQQMGIMPKDSSGQMG